MKMKQDPKKTKEKSIKAHQQRLIKQVAIKTLIKQALIKMPTPLNRMK